MFIALLAAVPVRIVSQPESNPSWDDPTVLIAGAGVAATLLAVVVALAGPSWNARRRRPKIDLEADPPNVGLSPDAIEDASVPPVDVGLRISNAAGRDTARDVEVFISAKAPDGGGTHIAAEEVNLLFGRLTSRSNPTSVSIPAGYSRRVALAALGNPRATRGIFSRLRSPLGIRPSWAALVVEDMPEHFCWLDERLSYRIEIVVTGANFDAITFDGMAETDAGVAPDGYRYFRWLDPPTRRAGS